MVVALLVVIHLYTIIVGRIYLNPGNHNELPIYRYVILVLPLVTRSALLLKTLVKHY